MSDEIKIEIVGVKNKFSKEDLPNGVDSQAVAYTDDVAAMEKAIDVLDGYDDFDSLKIDSILYRKTNATHGYGIELSNKIHSNGVILKHQENAAHMFLKNLRGFGLLADVVGSGKTFEAGVVLSELVYRGRVGSLLIVAPNEVIDSWQEVLIKKFGLGKSPDDEDKNAFIVISRLDRDTAWTRIPCKKYRPQRPILVDLEVFKEWASVNEQSQAFSQNYIFDMIIVDEAHELCKGTNIKALGLISRMIHEKKKVDNDNGYCLMLSATPHDGDLKSMFNLWYFIRRKGGVPEEFFAKEDRHGMEYNSEHDFYFQTVCYGADNVSDFIRKKKVYDFLKSKSGIESDLRIRFAGYLIKQGKSIYDFDEDSCDEWERERLIDEYLENNESERKMEMAAIARAYRELLGLIMIRQSRKEVVNISAHKKTVNVYFYPVKSGSFANKSVDSILPKVKRLDYSSVIEKFPNVYYPNVIASNGEEVPVNKYLSKDIYKEDYADIISGLFKKLETTEYAADSLGKSLFKKGFDEYYINMLREFDDSASTVEIYRGAENAKIGQFNLFMPYEYASSGDGFENKINYTLKILDKHSEERVIIFFDYALDSNREKKYEDGREEESIYNRVENELRKTLNGRKIISIDGTNGVSEQIKKDFDDDRNSSNCVLIVKSGYTHGANLQKAAVIINFQVSCDPVDMEQKMGRIFRLGQENDITIYSLADMHELEGYALAYFSRIGLFAVDSGDATILSGSNSSKMVTVRCKECNSLKIMTEEEYNCDFGKLKVILSNGKEFYVCRIDKDNKKAYAKDGNEVVSVPYKKEYVGNGLICCNEHAGAFILMEQINNNRYECDNDKSHRFSRSKVKGDEGYKCMEATENRIMCSTCGENNRTLFCNKLCVLSHCDLHKIKFPECAAVKAFSANEPYSICVNKCLSCDSREECERGVSSCSCKPTNNSDAMLDRINQCIECRENMHLSCRPKAHILNFSAGWSEADCPICSRKIKQDKWKASSKVRGKLKVVPLNTFSDHIRYLWESDIDDDSLFCQILEGEAEKVGDIKTMLQRSGDED